jgi:hypothetical protein
MIVDKYHNCVFDSENEQDYPCIVTIQRQNIRHHLRNDCEQATQITTHDTGPARLCLEHVAVEGIRATTA